MDCSRNCLVRPEWLEKLVNVVVNHPGCHALVPPQAVRLHELLRFEPTRRYALAATHMLVSGCLEVEFNDGSRCSAKGCAKLTLPAREDEMPQS